MDSINIYSLGHCIQSRVEFYTSLLCIQCCVRATNTSIDRVNKQHSIHNSIALIICTDHLDMPFNVHTTDKVTMITVSGFLTI